MKLLLRGLLVGVEPEWMGAGIGRVAYHLPLFVRGDGSVGVRRSVRAFVTCSSSVVFAAASAAAVRACLLHVPSSSWHVTFTLFRSVA